MTVPVPVQPIYAVPEANKEIILASEEDVKVLVDGVEIEGKANVCLRFLPKPRLLFNSTLAPTPGTIKAVMSAFAEGKNITVHFLSWALEMQVLIEKVANIAEQLCVTLFPNPQEMNISNLSTPDLRKVVFHVPNFCEFYSPTDCVNSSRRLGCIKLAANGWIITLSAMPSTHIIVKELKKTSGYGITHVGKIELENKEVFTKKQAEDILQCLNCFLSFARGFRTPSLLTVGFGTQDRRIWEQWGVRRIDQWQSVCSWFDEAHGKLLVELFPGFISRWKDDVWKESLEESVHWYLMGNMQAGGLEGAIILTQTALELLAWVYSVEDRGLISQKGFNDLSASDKLRLLLSSLDIPCEIPDQLVKIKTAAKHLNWKDAPQAFTELRNSIVHSNRKNREKFSGMKFEGWQLGLWHVELTLLRLFSHNGNYRNRLLTGQWAGHVEKVPWAA